MKSYLDLLAQCYHTGVRQQNRTGIDTFMIPGGMMQFDLAQGFPILTTKRVPFRMVVAELLGFIRGYTNASDFRKLGCKIWDANANENKDWLKNPHRHGVDDLGRIYGAQWRRWNRVDRYPGGEVFVAPLDQLARALDTIEKDPTSRRIIVSAWRPDELDQMALPPCHLLYQFLVTQLDRRLHMTMTMRSCDMFLGVPFNISSYALLLSLVARVTGYEVGTLTMFLADVHVYENHLDQVKEQLNRAPLLRPKLRLEVFTDNSLSAIDLLERAEPGDIDLLEYAPHPAIRGEMAV